MTVTTKAEDLMNCESIKIIYKLLSNPFHVFVEYRLATAFGRRAALALKFSVGSSLVTEPSLGEDPN